MDKTQWRFADMEFDPSSSELLKAGVVTRLPPQVGRTLELLLERAGEVVSRRELADHLWPDSTVEVDQGLNSCIRQLRRFLQDRAEDPRFVETLPRIGYRWIAPPAVSGLALQPPSATRLRWVVVALASVILIAALIGTATGLRSVDAAAGDAAGPELPIRLFVEPFEILAADPGLSALGGMIGDGVLDELAALAPKRLQVVAGTTSTTAAGPKASWRSQAQVLGADLVLAGALTSSSDRLRGTIELLRVEDGTRLWRSTFDHPRADTAGIPRDAAGQIASALSLVPEPGLGPNPTPAPPSRLRELLSKGHFVLRRGDPASLESAGRFFSQAIEVAPAQAAPWAALAEVRFDQRRFEEARQACDRALRLDDRQPDAWLIRGILALERDWDATSAVNALRRASELAPARARNRSSHAFVLALVGRHDEALEELGEALARDPVSPLVNGDLGLHHLWAGHPEAAARQCARTLELVPGDPVAEICRLDMLAALGRTDEAVAYARELMI
ncbi:MAG: winged helix-turn-helix domain-containing protein, partial [Acidobacteria bacterium]|nr:winged helix-turn-helix domain-containing protein [Acidobacteriota bacterium]